MPRRATGPRTVKGKANSSQNARKHGLNTSPSPDLVSAWFHIILNTDEDTYKTSLETGEREELAMRLAFAEACYHRALHQVRKTQSTPNFVEDAITRVVREFGISGSFTYRWTNPSERRDAPTQFISIKQLEHVLRALARERRLYQRYLGEARAQRKKALKAWCAFNMQEKTNSRNELQSNS